MQMLTILLELLLVLENATTVDQSLIFGRYVQAFVDFLFQIQDAHLCIGGEGERNSVRQLNTLIKIEVG